jgi:Tfp pilus assembly PilM family ATPase
VVDIENYALTRAAMACSLANAQDKTYGILLLRKELITLVVVTAKQHMYARTAPLEPAENYAASMVQTIGQLVKSVNFSHDFVEVTELLLAGEYAEDSLADLISQKLHLPVSLVTPPPRVQGCMAAEVFPHYFLSLGLALWSK